MNALQTSAAHQNSMSTRCRAANIAAVTQTYPIPMVYWLPHDLRCQITHTYQIQRGWRVERTLEAELMDDAHQARVYAQADFSTSNQWFVDQLVAGMAPAL